MPGADRAPASAAAAAPAVSVVVPAYNVAAYIGAALDSISAQTYTDYEVVVVNDGSPDTEELERALEPYRGRVIYVRQENAGPGGARNTGVLRARGSYVAFLDGDDVWLPEYLAEQMKFLLADPSLDLVYSDAVLFGEGVPEGLNFMRVAPSRGAVTFESLLRFECSVITSCVVARRSALVGAGLFDPAFIRSEDYDLWLRLARSGGRFTYQRQRLARHRVHGASLAADVQAMLASQIEVYEKTARAPGLSREHLRLIAEQIERCRADMAFAEGKELFAARQFEGAARALRRANDFYRSRKLRVVLACLRLAPGPLWRVHNFRHGRRRGAASSRPA